MNEIEPINVRVTYDDELSVGPLTLDDIPNLDPSTATYPITPPLGELVVPEKKEEVQSNLSSDFTTASITKSPLVLDLDGDGVETTSVENGVYFDHDGNGFAEKTGWFGKDDGVLVRDMNNNGQIDNGSELFGDQTILSNGEKAKNGFEALADLDSNQDGILKAA